MEPRLTRYSMIMSCNASMQCQSSTSNQVSMQIALSFLEIRWWWPGTQLHACSHSTGHTNSTLHSQCIWEAECCSDSPKSRSWCESAMWCEQLVIQVLTIAACIHACSHHNCIFFIPQGKPHSSPLGTACENNHPQVAQLLINNGANVDYQDSVCQCNYLHCFT